MKIGARDVVHTANLILPPGEDAWLDFLVGDWRVRLNVRFVDEVHEEGKRRDPSISIGPEGDHAQLTLTNWSVGLGTATKTPVEVGATSDGRKLGLMIWHMRVGVTNRLDLQFSLEVRP